MSTFLFSEHVFGPIKSRRLGSSLGINLLSVNQKVCNFNCIYCECGLTHKLTKEDDIFVDKKVLLQLVEEKLRQCIKDKTPIDTITFAGNGEPTLHPNFYSIVKKIIELRDLFFPAADIAVLTNGYTIDRKRVRKALLKVDKAIVKLDAGDDQLLKLIDRPKGRLPIRQLIENIKSFEGELIIQTMFLRGSIQGRPFDNSKGKELESWIERIKDLAPKEVMLYSLDRDTPLNTLEAISKKELDEIAKKLNKLNINTNVV